MGGKGGVGEERKENTKSFRVGKLVNMKRLTRPSDTEQNCLEGRVGCWRGLCWLIHSFIHSLFRGHSAIIHFPQMC